MLNRLILPLISLLLLEGCAQVPEDGQFKLVADEVTVRSGLKPVWHVGEASHPTIAAEVKDLLSQPLTEASAVQITLLNNPSLQAKYSELGVSQADLVQAGLIANPSLGGIFTFPTKGGPTDLIFTLAFNFLNILTLPLRKEVAESEFEETRLHMVRFTLDLASQARMAYYEAIAAQQMKELSDQMAKVANAQYETTKAMREAGNTSELDVTLSRTLYEQAQIDYKRADTEAYQAKLNLALMLGANVEKYSITLNKKLPEPTLEQKTNSELKAKVLDKNIDSALLGQRLETLGRQYQVTNIKALIPELRLGGEIERDEGDWDLGPTFEFTIPIFDQGQAAFAKANFEIRGTQEQYAQTVLKVQTTLYTLQNKLLILKQQLEKMKKTILPLHQKACDETLRHFNAMNRGIIDLIRVKQNQIEANKKYNEILLDYWLTQSSLDQLSHGSLPSTAQTSTPMKAQIINSTSGGRN
jgi:cobalt-zinc-cadmium efflux system outer membrane protein